MSISREQYQAARISRAMSASASGGGKIHVTSTLRDRTPAPQPVALDDGQFKWGRPSSFNWGSSNNTKETGPYVNTTFDVNWPDYGLDPSPVPTPDPDDTEDEAAALQPLIYEWKEIYRRERTVRVTGSNGAYVDINRMEEVIFSIPVSGDGRPQFVRLFFNNGA